MSWYDPGHDIVLDEAAFDRAAADFIELSGKVQALRADIEALLQTLQSGFDTPAGRLFVSSCKNNLLDPLDQQKLVIDHISETLRDAKATYASVFSEYDQLNTVLRSYQ
ncbi:MAG: hypothetical protein J6Z45_06480 [Oscillospiraceae bacterium]|nr:hypothetical protein [Oscillospiraceae bacterium]